MLSRLALVITFVGSLGMPAIGQAQVGGWLDASAAMSSPAASSFEQVSIFPYRQESFQATHVYTTERGPSFDIGGGIRVGSFGVGLAVSHYADTQNAQVSISVPNLLVYNRPSTTSASTQNPLTHTETAVHVEARYIVNLPHASVSIFAGPSYFNVAKDLVVNDKYTETYNFATTAQTEVLTGYDVRRDTIHPWGYNVGADVSYYFSELIGIGGLVRFSRARATLSNAIETVQTGSAATTEMNVGGVNIGAGIRLRF